MGMVYSLPRGVDAERELANILWNKGFAVIRGPASGAGTRRRFQPDLVIIKSGKVAVIEVKRTSELPVYIRPEQVLGLSEFAKRAGAQAFIAVRLKGRKWLFFRLDEVKTTRRGGFKVEGKGIDLNGFIVDVLGFKKLTDFM